MNPIIDPLSHRIMRAALWAHDQSFVKSHRRVFAIRAGTLCIDNSWLWRLNEWSLGLYIEWIGAPQKALNNANVQYEIRL